MHQLKSWHFWFGVYCAEITERMTGVKDDSRVTIDELAGYFITVFTLPEGWYYSAAGFLLFRIMDIIKPPPAQQLQICMVD